MDKRSGNILIVDDNEEILIALKILLSSHFRRVDTESVPDRLMPLLKNRKFDLILLDMNFRAGMQTGNEGFYWMQKVREIDRDVPVIFITAYGDVELAIRSLKDGACDFIQKSWDENKILSTIMAAFRLGQSRQEVNRLKDREQHFTNSISRDFTLVKGDSEVMNVIYELINKTAVTDANVLITGESGTGKEVIAREIHRRSERSGEIFMAVDLGALQENLFESELFGHRKGAFTDAYEDKPGRIELASGGTLFFDEIANLPLNLQSKLLTVLQNKTITRLGENVPRSVDFRLITATNQSLDQQVKNENFREDLLYRIKTIEIEISPLRQRKEDIFPLAGYFLSEYSLKYNKEYLKISGQALNKLTRYNWPGNVRELQHTIEKAVILSSGKQLRSSDFHFDTRGISEERRKRSFNLEENEKNIILNALNTFNWNRSRTSEELGINRSTLYEKIKKYELKQI